MSSGMQRGQPKYNDFGDFDVRTSTLFRCMCHTKGSVLHITTVSFSGFSGFSTVR